jgi:hypothetical protein
MDRDAPPPACPDDAVPPDSPASVRLVGLVGVGLTVVAALLALVAALIGESSPTAVHTARLFLSFIGVITAGAALSMRPDLWWAWGLGSVASAFCVIGLPADWDSFHQFFRVLSGVAAAGAAVCAASFPVRVAVGSLAILFHFTGIFLSSTSPPPRPWMNEQLYTRVFNPYLQFIYMRNAYQFYSPEPGPASLLAFLLKTETGIDPATGKKKYDTRWIVIPRRPADVKDPLGLSYYRRLSLTEQVARGNLGLTIPTDQFEKSEVMQRRTLQAVQGSGVVIPLTTLDPTDRFYHPDPITIQYQIPNPDVTRFVLPSYASHVILENTANKEEAAKTTVKIYRIEHRTMLAEDFRRKTPAGAYPDPYYPPTYRPYFLGEFNARGDLIDPQEYLLYWLVPILPRLSGPNDPIKKTYVDYMSAHALDMKVQDVLEADESKGKVFNWSQLR